MKRLGFVLVALVAAAPARAADQAYSLYAAGKYDEAMRAGSEEGTAIGYATAARAALADATTREAPCLPCLHRAEDFAFHATLVDPKLPDGQTYLAVSFGYEARLVGPITARFRGYPSRAKKALDKALAADPKNPWALAALGGWNVEIVRTGGAALANLFYGAAIDDGLSDFDRALALAPSNLAIRYQYALSLSGYDADTYLQQIEDAFTRIARLSPQTAYERVAQKRASELAELLKKGDRRTFDVRVRKYQGYPP